MGSEILIIESSPKQAILGGLDGMERQLLTVTGSIKPIPQYRP